jgi:hypothetical protein
VASMVATTSGGDGAHGRAARLVPTGDGGVKGRSVQFAVMTDGSEGSHGRAAYLIAADGGSGGNGGNGSRGRVL